jgi:RNA polymerase sigma factor (TIGR02999 family)
MPEPDPTPDPHRITQLLRKAAANGADAAEELIPLVYDQLRAIARHRLQGERDGHTLQATELVHEAYLRLAPDLPRQDWRDRAHFYNAAAEAMRRILIDNARRLKTEKRGGGSVEIVPLNLIDIAGDDPERVIALDDAIQRLTAEDDNLGKVVRLRFFTGLTVEETAEVLGTSPRSVAREWAFARAWLAKELRP